MREEIWKKEVTCALMGGSEIRRCWEEEEKEEGGGRALERKVVWDESESRVSEGRGGK